jgi:hypothetical protein
MNHAQFISKLKNLVRKTAPSEAALWRRYLAAPDSNLEEFVASLCYTFLLAEESKRREIENSMSDEDALWFIQTFIENQAAAINKPSDTEPLLLGLVAVAVVGPNSDPRDVTHWVWELYLAAFIASIPERILFCERVGNLAAQQNRVNENIRLFPDRNEGLMQEHVNLMEKQEALKDEVVEGVDVAGNTPLMRAAMNGNLPALFDLLQKGEDINAVTDGVAVPGGSLLGGISALAWAAWAGREAAVDLLLNSGARIDVKPNGISLLRWTRLGGGSPGMVERLKRAGAKE